MKYKVEMDTRRWGPDAWKMLHGVAAALPRALTPREADAFRRMITALRHVLPCIHCRKSYAGFMVEVDTHFGTRKDAEVFVWKLHNLVNTKLGKPTVDFEVAEARGRVVNWRASAFNFLSYISKNDAKDIRSERRRTACIFTKMLVACWPDQEQRVMLTKSLPSLCERLIFWWVCRNRELGEVKHLPAGQQRQFFDKARVKSSASRRRRGIKRHRSPQSRH